MNDTANITGKTLKPFVFSLPADDESAICWEHTAAGDYQVYRISDRDARETIETLQRLLERRAAYDKRCEGRKRAKDLERLLAEARRLLGDDDQVTEELRLRVHGEPIRPIKRCFDCNETHREDGNYCYRHNELNR